MLTYNLYECVNNPGKSSATKLHKHISCRYSMSTTWTFDNIANKPALYCKKIVRNSFIILKPYSD